MDQFGSNVDIYLGCVQSPPRTMHLLDFSPEYNEQVSRQKSSAFFWSLPAASFSVSTELAILQSPGEKQTYRRQPAIALLTTAEIILAPLAARPYPWRVLAVATHPRKEKAA